MAPDAEPLVQAWLSARCGVRVATGGKPTNAALPLVTLARTGTHTSAENDVDNMDYPVITVKSWAGTVPDARALAGKVSAAMRHVTSQDYFTYCKEINKYQASGEAGECQYVAVYDLAMRQE